jgi:hypothetical protein
MSKDFSIDIQGWEESDGFHFHVLADFGTPEILASGVVDTPEEAQEPIVEAVTEVLR